MAKKLFVESVSAPLTYKEPKEHSNALGRLEGVGGSWKEPTRNDRLYNKRLWENVKNSESFQEGMETRTIFAEANHPEERIDIDIKEVAGVLTDLEILDNGDIFTGFDILPTPNGKIIKTLLDYGCKIGVSSRGLGDEIVENGVTCIDPDTYEYYCHDFVVTPAVKKARPQVIEEKENRNFVDKVQAIVNEVKSSEELKSIKRLIETTEIPSKGVLVESINNKISSLSESADNQGNAGEEVTKVEETEALKVTELENKISNLETSIAKKDEELAKTKAQLKRRGDNARYFRRALQEQGNEMKDLELAVNEGLESISSLSRDLKEANATHKAEIEAKDSKISQLQSILREARRGARHSALLESKLNDEKRDKLETLSTVKKLQAENTKLKDTLEERDLYIEQLESKLRKLKAESISSRKESNMLTEAKNSKIQSLNEKINRLENQSNTLSFENKKLNKKIESEANEVKTLRESNEKMMEEYIRKSCQAANLKYEAVINMISKPYTMESVNAKIAELSDRQRRFDMLPLSMPAMSGRVVEHKSSSLSGDDTPTFVVESLKRGGNN